MKKSISVLLSSLAATSVLAASSISFDLMHTKPVCSYPGKASTYCEKDDMLKAQQEAGMVDRINGLLEELAIKKAQAGGKPKVYVAYLSFTNKPVQRKLCEVGKAGIQLEIVLDNGSRGQGDSLVADCQKDKSNPNVKLSYLGGMTSSPWRLHHNKFLIIDGSDGSPVSVNFSSGNLSAYGTSLHMDHWVLMTAPSDSNLVKTHYCVIDGLHAALAEADRVGMYSGGSVNSQYDTQVAGIYVTVRDQCIDKQKLISPFNYEKAMAAEGVAPLFAPNSNDEVFRVLRKEIRKVTAEAQAGRPAYLYIAIQHFLHMGVLRDLLDAANAGADVRIVMDDDVVNGGSEVQGAPEFYRDYLKGTGIKIRFAQTNSQARQMMHNKLAILNGKRTFSGAGHYTTAALRDNWENFYLIENAELLKKYAAYFKEIWDLSVDENVAISGGVSGAAGPLGSDFLKLIKE